jgi:hypothetical protein
MGINYKEVRNDRQWKASTGVSEEQFFNLVKMFGEAYEQLFGVYLGTHEASCRQLNLFKQSRH